jgi:hypothetical protein
MLIFFPAPLAENKLIISSYIPPLFLQALVYFCVSEVYYEPGGLRFHRSSAPNAILL